MKYDDVCDCLIAIDNCNSRSSIRELMIEIDKQYESGYLCLLDEDWPKLTSAVYLRESIIDNIRLCIKNKYEKEVSNDAVNLSDKDNQILYFLDDENVKVNRQLRLTRFIRLGFKGLMSLYDSGKISVTGDYKEFFIGLEYVGSEYLFIKRPTKEELNIIMNRLFDFKTIYHIETCEK